MQHPHPFSNKQDMPDVEPPRSYDRRTLLSRLLHCRTSFILSLFSGILVGAAFPPLQWWPLCFLGLILLSYQLLHDNQTSPLSSAVHFFLFSFATLLVGFYWLPVPLNTIFGLRFPVGIPATILFASLYALPYGLSGYCWSHLQKRMSGVEQLKSFSFLFLATYLIGIEQIIPRPGNWSYVMAVGSDPYLLASASVFGTLGWQCIFNIFVTFIAQLALTSPSKAYFLKCSSVALLVFCCTTYGVGYSRLSSLKEIYHGRQPVALMQNNMNVSQRLVVEHGNAKMRALQWKAHMTQKRLVDQVAKAQERTTRDALGRKRELWVVWPETEMLQPMFQDSKVENRAKGWITKTTGLHFLGGGEETSMEFGNKKRKASYNVIGLFNKDGYVEHYRKIIRFPFGEYVPGDSLYPEIYDHIPEIPLSGLSTDYKLLPHPDPNGPVFIPAICYEILFSSHLKKFIRKAHQLYPTRELVLVNLSSDAWYGDTSEPHLHAFLARWQAASLALPLLRSTNTGFSEVVAPWGEVLATGPRNKRAVIYGELPVKQTYYEKSA